MIKSQNLGSKPLAKVNLKELNEEEAELEKKLREKQLEKIFELLKEQEALNKKSLMNDQIETTAEINEEVNQDCKFSVLKENGTYEVTDINLRDDFQSQLKLYGL